ncbi:choice-of-anchor Q domain-containing protein [Rubrivirga sp.]|uniref:choice-of-anchor Q domain-containing protein n=1 Tax=Rubrivirga sp. TaxID=1885344 RepID=UPI003C75CE7B
MARLYARLLVLAFFFASVGSVSADTITVTTLEDETTDNGNCSFREAVEAANTDEPVGGCEAGDGADEIIFDEDLESGSITFQSGPVTVTDSLTVDGSTSETTSVQLSGDFLFRLIEVESSVLTLTNIRLARGRGARGGAVLVQPDARLVAEGVSFTRNEATGSAATDGGAAVYVEGGSATMTNVSFDSNRATGTSGSGGAVFNNRGTVTLRRSSFTNNEANRAGGGIEANGGSTLLTDVSFSRNRAGSNPGNGGAFHITGSGSASIRGGTVSRNVASSEGGGFWNSTGTMTIARTVFTDNRAEGADADNGGGAVFNNGGDVRMDTTTVNRNSATGAAGSGGGVFNNGGTLTVRSGVFTSNVARRAGGGIEDANGIVAVVASAFSQNTVIDQANPGNGGAIHSGGGTVTVSGGEFDSNRAVEGGGIWTSGDLIVTSGGVLNEPAVFTNNIATGDEATQGGGALYATPSGTMTVADAQITDNVASGTLGSGGGVFSAGVLTMTEAVVSRNRANRAGGGIEDAGGTVILEDVVLRANTIGTAMPGNGGGLHSGGGDVIISGGLVENNVAVEGGGVWVSGTLALNGGAGDIGLAGDDGDGNGDGRDDEGNDRRDDDEDAIDGDRSVFTLIRNNRATGDAAGIGGGGIFVETGGAASLRYVTLEGNAATGTSGSGGGLMLADGTTASIAFSQIVENRANRAGGGIELFDDAATGAATTSVEMRNVTIDGNSIATAMPGNGGGLHAGGAGQVFVRQTTVSNNSAREGGGLWIAGGGELNLGNSTVTRNTATDAGGGVYDNGGATISIASSTIALNEAGSDGGGLVSQGQTFTLTNTIVGANEATGQGADCRGTFQSGGNNLIESDAGCTFEGETSTNVTGVTPMLGPLRNNGGFTLTHAPAAGSPAVDAGNSMFEFDQRGLQRGGFGSGVGQDIGAVELNGTPVAEEDGPEGDVAFALLPTRPNPVANRATVSFTVAEAGSASVAVYNVLGQRVLTAYQGDAAPGSDLEADLDVSTLAAGVYLVRLESAGQMAVQQITVVR